MENLLRNGVDLQGMYNAKTINGDAHFFEDVTTPAKVRQYLDSFQEADKLKGMKLLLAMLSKGKDIPEFFPDVVKNVVVRSIEVKKMVYIYLVHYADFNDSCREIALLSINSFQKDMSGTNPLIRGLALRVMTSIRVSDIIQIQLLAVRKCATDTSPYVRKCAANAVPKIFSMDPEQLDSLKLILETLLKDSSTMVLGSTVAALNEVCPEDYSLLHRNHRKLCHLLADMDEWTQISVLEVLTRYVRNQFTDPAPTVTTAVRLQAQQRGSANVKNATTTKGLTTTAYPKSGSGPSSVNNNSMTATVISRRVIKKAFYSDEEDHSEEETIIVPDKGNKLEYDVFTSTTDNEDHLDPDHQLVLKSSLPLLKSRNSGVVLAVCTLHYYCGTYSSSTLTLVAKALVRVLRNRREVQYIVLSSINTMCKEMPHVFRPFLSDFFIKATDPTFNRLLKLEILTSLSHKDNLPIILKELQAYIKEKNETFVCSAIRTVGQIADRDVSSIDHCTQGIMHVLLCTKTASIITECVNVLTILLLHNPDSAVTHITIKQLAKLLIIENGIETPAARSSVVYLIAHFHSVLAKVAPDILRILSIGFAHEDVPTKCQIMNFAIKLSLLLPEHENVQTICMYILEMSRYDVDTDLRDRSRFMTALLGLVPSSDNNNEEEGQSNNNSNGVSNEDALAELNEHAHGIMLGQRLPPVTGGGAAHVEGVPQFTLGSLSSIVGHNVQGYTPLPDYPAHQPDPSIRDSTRYNTNTSGDNNYGGSSGNTTNDMYGNNTSTTEVYRDTTSGDLNAFYGSKSRGRGSDTSSSDGSSSDSSGSFSDSESSSGSESSDSESNATSNSSSDNSTSDSDSSASTRNRRQSSNKGSKHSPLPVPAINRYTNSTSNNSMNSAGGTTIPTQPSPAPVSATNKAQPMQGMRKATANRARDANTLLLPTTNTNTSTANYSNVSSVSSGIDLMGLGDHTHTTQTSNGLSSGHVDFDTVEPLLLPSTTAPAMVPSVIPSTTLLPLQPASQQAMPPSNPVHAGQGNISAAYNPIDTMYTPAISTATSSNALILGTGLTGLVHNHSNTDHSAMMGNRGAATMNIVPGTGLAMNTTSPGMLGVSNMDSNNVGGLSNSGRMMMQQPLAITQTGGAGPLGAQQAMQPQQGASVQAYSSQPALNEHEHHSLPKMLLKPEMGGGLSVSLVYRHNVPSVALIGANSVYLVLRNLGEQIFRRLRISFPVDVKRTNIPEIPVFNPAQELWIPVEIVLAGYNGKQVKVDIRSDKGASAGLLSIQDCDLLMPLFIPPADFVAIRSRLGGFSESVKTFTLTSVGISSDNNSISGASYISGPSASVEYTLLHRTLSALNMYTVQGVGKEELMVAGSVRKGLSEHRLLITLLTTASSDEATVRINCEDPVLCSGLSDVLLKMIATLGLGSNTC